MHKYLIKRVEYELKETHYVRKYIFKANNTFSITRVFLKEYPKKYQDLESHTLKIKSSEVKNTGVEWIKGIIVLAHELEKT